MRRVRVTIVALCTALAVTAGGAAAQTPGPRADFEDIFADAWGFALFAGVPLDAVAHLIPDGWTPVGCTIAGREPALVPGTVQLLLAGKREHIAGEPALPDQVTHWTLGLCARPPSADMLLPGQTHTGLSLRSWIDSEQAQRFEQRFGLNPQLASFTYTGDIEAHNWGVEVRSPAGDLLWEANFNVAAPQAQCLNIKQLVRLYEADVATGEVGAYHIDALDNGVTGCFGSPTVVEAPRGSFLAGILGETRPADAAGAEVATTDIGYERLRPPSGR